MGNLTSFARQPGSDELKPKSISQVLDYIATYYILTMDFKSLRKLYDKDYCDKLVILTSDIVERYFTDLEVTYLAQRMKNGEEINELTKDKVIFFNRDNLDKLDVQNSVKKKRICLSIAKFYIKIAHVFAAILTTINPVYVYKDEEGNKVKATLYEKGKIPEGTPRDIFKLNICDNRINALRNNQDFTGPDITVAPKVCSFNMNSEGNLKSLSEEPGIPELADLYYDDGYDIETGKFQTMSPESQKLFNEDLKIFYNVFTGNKDMPPEITKFSEIKLRDYGSEEKCKGSNPLLRQRATGPLTNKLFAQYADNLRRMVDKTNNNQLALLNILNEIFVYTVDPQTHKKQIRISPKLTEDRLQQIVVETRALIIKLYLTCEMDYVNGIKIYEAIVEQKILETAQSQINNLDKMSDQLITEENIPKPAELKEIQENAEQKIEEKKEEIAKQEQEIQKTEEVKKNPEEVLKPQLNQPDRPLERQTARLQGQAETQPLRALGPVRPPERQTARPLERPPEQPNA